MKHPKHRVTDVLRWHPKARQEVYDYVTEAVYSNLPAWILDLLSEIQHVGSMTWGASKLRSDCDFNISLKKDISWLDLGMMDVEADVYNVYVSIPKMLLYHRTTSFFDDFVVGEAGIDCNVEDPNPINLLIFDPAINPVPPPLDLHLRWDGYHLRWRRDPASKPWKQGTVWALTEEKWSDEVDEWKKYYGDYFQKYDRTTIQKGDTAMEQLVPA